MEPLSKRQQNRAGARSAKFKEHNQHHKLQVFENKLGQTREAE
jgi:hypothetical protein